MHNSSAQIWGLKTYTFVLSVSVSQESKRSLPLVFCKAAIQVLARAEFSPGGWTWEGSTWRFIQFVDSLFIGSSRTPSSLLLQNQYGEPDSRTSLVGKWKFSYQSLICGITVLGVTFHHFGYSLLVRNINVTGLTHTQGKEMGIKYLDVGI